MLRNIQALLTREKGLLETRKSNNVNKIKSFEDFQSSYKDSQDEDEVALLKNSCKRHECIEKGLNRATKLTFNKVFTEYRRDVEVYSVAKMV